MVQQSSSTAVWEALATGPVRHLQRRRAQQMQQQHLGSFSFILLLSLFHLNRCVRDFHRERRPSLINLKKKRINLLGMCNLLGTSLGIEQLRLQFADGCKNKINQSINQMVAFRFLSTPHTDGVFCTLHRIFRIFKNLANRRRFLSPVFKKS